jgi:two-component system LytT family sensor kinase
VRLRFRYTAVSLLITSVPVLLAAVASRTPEPGQTAVPLWRVLALSSAEFYPWATIAPFIDGWVRRSRPASHTDRVRVFAGHVLLWLGFALAHRFVVSTVRAAFMPDLGGISRPMPLSLLLDAVLYLAITAAFTIAETRRRQTEVAEGLRAEVAEARLDALRQQLNPHFLFNTLNYIVMQLRSREVEPAERMLLSLSDLLRDVLRERAQLIPLRDEVRMVERYLEIERERFGARLEAEVTFEPRVLDALVPSLILQPLLENAMRHGVSAADGHCRLWLSARVTGDRVRIEVRDAGLGIHPKNATPPAGVGLTNTAERLRYLYGKDHSFTLRTLDEGGLLVSIDLPLRRG